MDRAAQRFLEARHIPAVGIRGAADYTHVPISASGKETDDDSGGGGGARWIEQHGWVSSADEANLTSEGYRFSIETTSEVVLRLFESRSFAP